MRENFYDVVVGLDSEDLALLIFGDRENPSGPSLL